MGDGYYYVSLVNGVKVEAFKQTLAPRSDDLKSNIAIAEPTAAWRGELYTAPIPKEAGGMMDSLQKIARSVLQKAKPEELYWSDNPASKKRRRADAKRTQKIIEDQHRLKKSQRALKKLSNNVPSSSIKRKKKKAKRSRLVFAVGSCLD